MKHNIKHTKKFNKKKIISKYNIKNNITVLDNGYYNITIIIFFLYKFKFFILKKFIEFNFILKI